MDSTSGVTPEDSPTPETAVAASAPATDVTVPSAEDRPEENRYRELLRKFDQQQRQLEQLQGYLLVQNQPKPETAPQKVLTNEELWAQAQSGDREAFELYQERIADRRVDSRLAEQRKEQITRDQLRALMNKYPVLNTGSHPLTVAVNDAYRAYVANGYPAGQATMLEAAKTAIADNPELIAQMQGSVPAREVARQTATTRSQAGVTGVSHRAAPGTPAKRPLTQAEIDLAKRMGVKDPQRAKDRFLERQQTGQSSVGQVSAFINTEDF